MFDDGTVDAHIMHGGPRDEREYIRYVYPTSEIIWERCNAAGMKQQELTGGEMLHIPMVDEVEARVITTVDPPYR